MKSIKYDYMEHWTIPTPVGYMKPFGRRSYMEKNVKELAALGFSGFQLMAATMATYARMFGGEKGTLVDFEKFIQDCGMDGITGMFWCNLSDRHETSSINPDFHDNILQIARNFAEQAKGTSIDTYIYMPAGCYCYEMPVTDDNVHILADLANKMGKMLLEDYGIRLTCHHEFWCGLRDYDEIIKYYEWTDPKYVNFFCDTAQHTIAGVDCVALYNELADRTLGFHLKDTRDTDEKYYRIPPDAELMASEVPRWFYEAGSGKGLVNFEELFKAIRKHNYKGWIGVEHDKADMDGQSFSECTAVSMWYIKNVLEPILKEDR